MGPNPAATAVAHLYQLSGAAFDQRFAIMAINIRRELLEHVVNTPAELHADTEDLLSDMSSGLIRVQVAACRAACLTEGQELDFETRLDNCLAEAVDIVRQCIDNYGEHRSPAFQQETAAQLGIPVVQ